MIVTTMDVFCDGLDPDVPDCPQWVGGAINSTATAARRAAAAEGWVRKSVHGSTRDLCPECQVKLEGNRGR